MRQVKNKPTIHQMAQMVLNRAAQEIGCTVFYDKLFYLVGDGVILIESESATVIQNFISNIKYNVYLAKADYLINMDNISNNL